MCCKRRNVYFVLFNYDQQNKLIWLIKFTLGPNGDKERHKKELNENFLEAFMCQKSQKIKGCCVYGGFVN